jgi:Transposase DDE domain
VWAASWFHDGSAPEARKSAFGNNWVIVAIVVRLPFMTRPVSLPVLARLVVKDTVSASRLQVARCLITTLADALPGRRLDVVADAAYAGGLLKDLPEQVTWTTRLRKDAALYALPPASAGRRGRPRLKGDRLPGLHQLAAGLAFAPLTVTRYGRTEVIEAAGLRCLWYGVFGARPVQVIVIRSVSGALELALVTTDTSASIATLIERYAARWSIEAAILEAKQIFGVGQARNRTTRAVTRTVPFGLAAQTLTICWYALHGRHRDDLAAHRHQRPWYATKSTVSIADAHAALRRAIIAAKYLPRHADQPKPEEIRAVLRAWENVAA